MDYIQIIWQNKIRLGEIEDIEGEVMHVFLKNPAEFEIGDSVHCLFSTIRFESKVLKKDNQCIYLFIPIFLKKFPNERRKFPRLDVNCSALINDFLSEKVFEQAATMEVNIIDISLSGFGLLSCRPLKKNIPYFLYVKGQELSLNPKVIIHNEKYTDQGIRYGSEILSISKKDLCLLRKFILSEQLAKQNLIIDHK